MPESRKNSLVEPQGAEKTYYFDREDEKRFLETGELPPQESQESLQPEAPAPVKGVVTTRISYPRGDFPEETTPIDEPVPPEETTSEDDSLDPGRLLRYFG